MCHGEKFNSVSHMVGAVAAAIGAILLVILAGRQGDPWKIVGFSVYGAMLLSLYVTSVLYHRAMGPEKEVMRKFDHCAIYLLIAGSYTPFALVSLRDAWGLPLLAIIWSIAAVGILQEIWFAKGARIVSLSIYVLMGWLALIVVIPLIAALTWAGFALLAVGGLAYTVGIVFYALDRRIPHGHGIWHLFVLAGSACHYFSVLFYVA